jgi:hypothetical protein
MDFLDGFECTLGVRRGRDRMIVGFSTTCASSFYYY